MKYFVLPRRNLTARYGYKCWAVVSGASDGLGKQYAVELAEAGFNIILVARNKDKTDLVAKEIAKSTGVQTKVIIFDFS